MGNKQIIISIPEKSIQEAVGQELDNLEVLKYLLETFEKFVSKHWKNTEIRVYEDIVKTTYQTPQGDFVEFDRVVSHLE